MLLWRPALTQHQDGESREGDSRPSPELHRPGRGVRDLRGAHVEGDILHRGQHCDGTDRVGRPVDELCDAEYRADAVQAQRISDEDEQGPPSCSSAHHHLPGDRTHWIFDFIYRGQMHQLLEEGSVHGKRGDHIRLPYHPGCDFGFDSRVLVSRLHHHGLSEPTHHRDAEEGDWRIYLYRLGICGVPSDWGNHPHNLVSPSEEVLRLSRLPTTPKCVPLHSAREPGRVQASIHPCKSALQWILCA